MLGDKGFQWLVKDAALKVYGVILPDLYCELILSGKMRLSEAVKEYLSHDSLFPAEGRIVH